MESLCLFLKVVIKFLTVLVPFVSFDQTQVLLFIRIQILLFEFLSSQLLFPQALIFKLMRQDFLFIQALKIKLAPITFYALVEYLLLIFIQISIMGLLVIFQELDLLLFQILNQQRISFHLINSFNVDFPLLLLLTKTLNLQRNLFLTSFQIQELFELASLVRGSQPSSFLLIMGLSSLFHLILLQKTHL